MPENEKNFKDSNNTDEQDKTGISQDPKARKLFGVLLLVGVAAIGFGAFQLYNVINSPFAGRVSLDEVSLTEEEVATIDELQYVDTDNDTLSDYDELFRYNTSPFLSDSDSDGQTDAQEISANSDPNCPEGKDCAVFANNSDTNSSAASATDIEQLRETLKNAGAPEYVLDNTSDEDLQALYEDTINDRSNTGSLLDNSNVASGTDLVSADSLQQLTTAEIRELLIAGGISESSLNDVAEDTLRAIFLEAVSEEYGLK
ncbi:MAG: hypothetical protein V1838_00215 [Patescibacteria group bacterium]